MTFEEFATDFLAFLDSSNVNLGRKGTKTREAFLAQAEKRFRTFGDDHQLVVEQVGDQSEKDKVEPPTDPLEGKVMRIKPSDPRRALDVGKGVHAMTPSESARADEQLNRSPYVGRQANDD